MAALAETLEITGQPVHVEAWSAARIPGFVLAVLARWQRHHGALPERFSLALCPQVEVNAMGGIPPRVHELTDPRLRCSHFTGCHKPYVVIIFTGDDARERLDEVLELLAWSEGYEVDADEARVHLAYVGSTEDLDDDEITPPPRRSLQELIQTGELVRILG